MPRISLVLLTAVVLAAAGSARPAGETDPPRQLSVLSSAQPPVGQSVDFELTDLDGKTSWLSEIKGSEAYVLVMRDIGCPVSGRYAKRIAQLEEAYARRGVTFLFLNVNETNTPAQIREGELARHGLKGRYIHEPSGRIATLLGVRSTTEVFVLDRTRRLRYRGAIDDQYGVGWSRQAARHEYLKAALDSVLIDEPVAVTAVDVPGCALPFGDVVTGEPVTYHKQISRIVQNHCQSCHRADGMAPFALETYEQMNARRTMIRKMVKTRRMPPWFAHRDVGTFANDRSLSDRDLHLLLRWVDEGAVAGNVADAPAPRTWPAGWQIGKPDAIVKMTEPFAVPAEGTVDYQYFYVRTDFPEDRWIQRMELRPGAKQQVHHALVFLEEPGRKQDPNERKAGEPPFQTGAGGFFAGYAPGYPGLVFPEGTARKLPKGAWLKFQMHYTTSGVAAVDQTELGFVFAKQPPAQEVVTRAVGNFDFAIPAGAPNHAVVGERTFKDGGRVLAFFPHMHVRGKAFRVELVAPDGAVKPLLSLPRYDFNWQLSYIPTEPIEVAPGWKLRATGWFDNSEENPANPDAKAEVRFGEQSWDEMMIGYFDWVAAPAPPAAAVASVPSMQ